MGEYKQITAGCGPQLMEKSSQNIQDSFLNNARKEKLIITIVLLGGVKLNGRIKSFDKYSLILESNREEHLVFKHAISTVVTGRNSPSGTPQPGSQEVAPAATPGPGNVADELTKAENEPDMYE